ncbi:SH3 domain-containing protein [Nitratireductor sp. GCM10026969]|uniref:SH3 domain-containing protein n=1 Tax=Nitratireductor sp. GCM10026969 TaxID=3252645 RepID=UPI00360BAFA2
MFSRIRNLAAAVLLLSAPTVALAQMDGHGPDAWQVTGVAPDDTLNARTGPGTDHLVIGAFPSDATGLLMVTCVPFLTRQKRWELTESQRANLPPRWCLVESPDHGIKGWVSARYLKEDTSAARPDMHPLVAEGVALVRRIYDRELSARSASAIGPLHPSVARRYFFPDGVARLAQGARGHPLEAHPLFGAQDADITQLQIFPAPERAMFRGMVSVHATFRNFGHPQQAVFRLRGDGSLDPPALRIMRIEHEGWAFP